MNQPIQTTTPNRPTGIPPPQVPLGIQGTFLPMVGTQPLEGELMQIRLNNPALYQVIEITTADTIGTRKLSFDTRVGLNINNYVKTLTQGSQILVPWGMIEAYYSRMSKVDYELVIQPIKVADCRVSMDFVFDFKSSDMTYDTKTLVNNNVHYAFDDPIDLLDLPIPMYWPVLNINTNIYSYNRATGFEVRKNSFLPSTKLNGFIAAPYVRLSLHPTTVTLVVWLRMVPRQLQGACAMKMKASFVSELETQSHRFLPVPYWYSGTPVYL